MIGVSATVTGERKVIARFRRVPADITAKVKPAVVKGAESIADLSRGFVPVDHGDLRDSIVTRQGDHELAQEVTAGNKTAFYARWVEFGTPTVPARPYFFPAYRALKRRVRARIANAVRRAVRGSSSLTTGL